MAKKIKMILYGEPGTGKSVFAGNAPRPFFITTDGNYEWIEGLVPNFDEKNHIQIGSFAEFEKLIPVLSTEPYVSLYDTYVLDLIDDLYTWADYEICKKNRVNHISELGDYGKGYDLLRKPFIAAILKFIAINKNIIILSHESTYEEKTKKGSTITRYTPSSALSLTKLWDKFSGQCQFVIRCFKDYETDENGRTVTNRLLHVMNTPEEWGTYRLLDPNTPDTIPLDWNVFADIIGLNNKISTSSETAAVVTSDMKHAAISEEVKPEVEKKTQPKAEAKTVTPKVQPKPQPQVEPQPVVEEKEEVVEETPAPQPKVKVETPKVKQIVEEDLPQTKEVPTPAATPSAPQSKADKIAELQRKLAEINAKKKNN